MVIGKQPVLDKVREWAEGPVRPTTKWAPDQLGYAADSLAGWACRSTAEDKQPLPPPTPDDTRSFSCFSILMLAMAHVATAANQLDEARLALKNRYVDSYKQIGWVDLLTKQGTLRRYDPLGGAFPLPGQLMFFNDVGHVVLAGALRPGTDRAYSTRLEVYSFYGRFPRVPADMRTPTPIALTTLADIRDYFTQLMIYQRVHDPNRHRQDPPLPVVPFDPGSIVIKFADPFWA